MLRTLHRSVQSISMLSVPDISRASTPPPQKRPNRQKDSQERWCSAVRQWKTLRRTWSLKLWNLKYVHTTISFECFEWCTLQQWYAFLARNAVQWMYWLARCFIFICVRHPSTIHIPVIQYRQSISHLVVHIQWQFNQKMQRVHCQKIAWARKRERWHGKYWIHLNSFNLSRLMGAASAFRTFTSWSILVSNWWLFTKTLLGHDVSVDFRMSGNLK